MIDMLPAGLYLIFDVHNGNYALREEDYVHLMRDGKLDWAGMAVEALRRIAVKRMGPPVEIQAVDDRGRMADLDMEKLHLLAEHTKLRRNPAPRSDGTDPAQNRAEIERMLASAPSDWRGQFNSGMAKRRSTGQGGGFALNIDNALLILGITAGGNASGDVALGKNKVPPAVRAAAMKGLRLSHGNNYGAWDFIGIARGIQLATQPGVPDETLGRMANYFSRHGGDTASARFGNDSSPSRGYMAWLNWGGDPGYEWASGTKKAKSNPVTPKLEEHFTNVLDIVLMAARDAFNGRSDRYLGYNRPWVDNIDRRGERRSSSEYAQELLWAIVLRMRHRGVRGEKLNRKFDRNGVLKYITRIVARKFMIVPRDLAAKFFSVNELSYDEGLQLSLAIEEVLRGTGLSLTDLLERAGQPLDRGARREAYIQELESQEDQRKEVERKAAWKVAEEWEGRAFAYPKGERVPEGREKTLERLAAKQKGEFAGEVEMVPGEFGTYAHVFSFIAKTPITLTQWRDFLKMKREISVSDTHQSRSLLVRSSHPVVAIFEGTPRLYAPEDIWSVQDSSGMRYSTRVSGLSTGSYSEAFLSPANAKLITLLVHPRFPKKGELQATMRTLNVPVVITDNVEKAALEKWSLHEHDDSEDDAHDDYEDYDLKPGRKASRQYRAGRSTK